MTKSSIFSLAFILSTAFFVTSCGSNVSKEEIGVENKQNKVEKDTTYAQYIKRNKIKTLTSKGFQYKFGEAQQPGFTLYVVHYNEEGLPVDSIIYNNNVIIGRFKNIYNTEWKLVNSTVLDSAGNEIESINRTFDKMGNEIEFIYLKNQKPFYRQKIEYNDKNQMSKIVEFDDSDTPKIVTEYLYNEKGKKIAKTEYNSKDVILSKESWIYDEKGNNIQYLIYDITGNILEKNYLKNFTEDGHPQLLEKYNEKDSLVVSHHYEYDSKGREIKSTLYNGINQILSQTNSQYDNKGNQISFEMYEGGEGLKGKDLITYNELNQEIELKVTGADGSQIKRKVTTYNDQKLLFEVINYDKLDDPNFKIQYSYEYYSEN